MPPYSEVEEQIGDVLKSVSVDVLIINYCHGIASLLIINVISFKVDIIGEEISRIDELVVKIAKNHITILSSYQNESE